MDLGLLAKNLVLTNYNFCTGSSAHSQLVITRYQHLSAAARPACPFFFLRRVPDVKNLSGAKASSLGKS